jgi:hypothetical protein
MRENFVLTRIIQNNYPYFTTKQTKYQAVYAVFARVYNITEASEPKNVI